MDTKLNSQHWIFPRLNNKPARNVTGKDKKHRTRAPPPTDLIQNDSTLSKLTVVLQATIRREHQMLLYQHQTSRQ